MDHHLWISLCIFYDTVVGAKHVHNCRKVKAANGKILRDKMGGPARISGPFLLYFRRNYVFGKANPGKTSMARKVEAAETKLVLSS